MRRRQKPSRSVPDAVKEAAVRRYLSTEVSYQELGRELGVDRTTVRGWVRLCQEEGSVVKKRSRGKARSTEQRSPEERLRLLLEGRNLGEEELGEFLRREGIREGDLERWEQDALGGLRESEPLGRLERRRHAAVKRKAKRQEKRLREAEALLELQKKVQALWAEEDDDTTADSD
jgi:transposase-like protein